MSGAEIDYREETAQKVRASKKKSNIGVRQ
jgi:hypothetical protein